MQRRTDHLRVLTEPLEYPDLLYNALLAILATEHISSSTENSQYGARFLCLLGPRNSRIEIPVERYDNGLQLTYVSEAFSVFASKH